jgi:hypothetical protein
MKNSCDLIAERYIPSTLKIKREERMLFVPVLFRCWKKTSKKKTADGGNNQRLIQHLHTRIYGTGRATEIMYIMTVALSARGVLTIGTSSTPCLRVVRIRLNF